VCAWALVSSSSPLSADIRRCRAVCCGPNAGRPASELKTKLCHGTKIAFLCPVSQKILPTPRVLAISVTDYESCCPSPFHRSPPSLIGQRSVLLRMQRVPRRVLACALYHRTFHIAEKTFIRIVILMPTRQDIGNCSYGNVVHRSQMDNPFNAVRGTC